VAGRARCVEEATPIVPGRPNPADSGDAADLSIPQGNFKAEASLRFEIAQPMSRCLAGER